MKIYLIRHTQVALPPGICYGQTDVELAASWQNDFAELHDKLRRTLTPDIVNTQGNTRTPIYSSPLKRCHKLAKHLSDTTITDDRLMEFDFGTWELLDWNAIPRNEMDAWRNDYMDTAVPDGESYRQLYDRTGAFYHELIEQSVSTVIVITHGGVILALLARLLGISPPESFRLKADFGSISAVTVEGDWIKIDYINR